MAQGKFTENANAENGQMRLLKPQEGVCQICATKHEPADPHNKQSLYYQVDFFITHGRYPTWEDAMSHCNNETKRVWTAELQRLGVEVGQSEEKKQGDK